MTKPLMQPRLEVHRIHRYPSVLFDQNAGMSWDEALAARPSWKWDASGEQSWYQNRVGDPRANMEQFFGNPDPLKLLSMEVHAKRCLLYGRFPADPSGLRGALGVVATWEGFYVRFAAVEGKYAQLRALGVLEHEKKHDHPLPINYRYQTKGKGIHLDRWHGVPLVPTFMRHALAGWIHMKYVELSPQRIPIEPAPESGAGS